MTSGNLLKKIRKRHGDKLTLTKVAEIIGISVVFASDIENDNRPFPVDRFDDFMAAYGFTDQERSEFALHLAMMGRTINDQVRKYLKIEVNNEK